MTHGPITAALEPEVREKLQKTGGILVRPRRSCP